MAEKEKVISTIICEKEEREGSEGYIGKDRER